MTAILDTSFLFALTDKSDRNILLEGVKKDQNALLKSIAAQGLNIRSNGWFR